MVFQVENALKEAGDKLDANDKASVEADLNALKDLLAQTANAQELTDSQVADTLTIPLASMSNVTSICGTPRRAGGIPSRRNWPRDLLSFAN